MKKKLKILLLGKDGQVGFELQRSLAPLGDLIALDSTQGNLLNLPELTKTILKISPDIMVNAAAYTAVDKAEIETAETEKSNLINAIAVKTLAEIAKKMKALLIHYSTDYVFDGSGNTPWTEEDIPKPLNLYGLSKFQGEQAIIQSGCSHLIFRTSWVYSARGNNFAKTILKLAQERESLKMIDDQIGAPTSAKFLAEMTAECIKKVLDKNTGRINFRLLGLYHLVPKGEISWYGYAKTLLELAEEAGVTLKTHAKDLIPIPMTEYPLPALRPKNSRLATQKFEQSFGLVLPDWKEGLNALITVLL
jgi:dTDP-4-dehydrorhamnose reductase